MINRRKPRWRQTEAQSYLGQAIGVKNYRGSLGVGFALSDDVSDECQSWSLGAGTGK